MVASARIDLFPCASHLVGHNKLGALFPRLLSAKRALKLNYASLAEALDLGECKRPSGYKGLGYNVPNIQLSASTVESHCPVKGA